MSDKNNKMRFKKMLNENQLKMNNEKGQKDNKEIKYIQTWENLIKLANLR